ncbi:MAG: DEAD/DEAH box helicase, partial [Bdellovibrionota bacterium]
IFPRSILRLPKYDYFSVLMAQMTNTFKDLPLSPTLAQAVEELGYTHPTPIQAATLPQLLEGPTDFLGLAATGTGKTAAFGIPLLEQLNNSRREVQALVLCPTRELALQVTQQLNLLGKYKKLKAVPVYGGAGYGDQISRLRDGAQIVVATPGRLIDHLERGTISLDKVETVILDEADEMISMGFKDELESILEMLPPQTYNTWLFSATMSKEVRRVADRFLSEPKVVQVNKTEMLSGTVRQIYYKVKESDKPDILCKLIDMEESFYGLIFCQTKSLVADLASLLANRGYKVDSLHGDKDQVQRERTMRAFREHRVNILVCTDVASRGLDVKDLTHVINYSIPRELDNYVHRIGRTGRSGKTGVALSLVTASHMNLITRIENMTKSKMEPGTIPNRKDVGTRKVSKLLEKFLAVQNPDRVETLLNEEWTSSLEKMSKAEIAARLLTLTFPDTFVDRDKTQQPQKVLGQAHAPAADHGGERRRRRDGREPRRDREHHRDREHRRDREPRRDHGYRREAGRSRDSRGERRHAGRNEGRPHRRQNEHRNYV